MVNPGNGVWLLENTGSWKDDPEDVNISLFTEGSDLWYAEYADIEHAGEFVADYDDLPGWRGIDTSMEEGHDMIKVSGTYQGSSFTDTQTKENNLQKFFRKHSSLDDDAFYFVKRWSQDHYKQFPDQDRSMQKYMAAKFAKPPATKIENRVLSFAFVLRCMWS